MARLNGLGKYGRKHDQTPKTRKGHKMVDNSANGREGVQQGLVDVLHKMIEDWDLELSDPIGPDTRIISDLGFESIDLVQLAVGIEENFGVRGLPYEEVFMKDGAYVTEITLVELVDFLDRHIPSHRVGDAVT